MNSTATILLRLACPSFLVASALPFASAQTIIDDDFEPGEFQFSATDFTAVEGDGQATITVQRVNGFDKAVSVRYLTVAGGTAAEPDDYLGVENMLQFAPGQVELRFTVPLVDDTAPETEQRGGTGTNAAGRRGQHWHERRRGRQR